MKIKILDTNIILDYPIQDILDSFGFEDVTVVIPFKVLVELDTFKKGTESTNEYCRIAIRFLDGLRNLGRLSDGVLYKENITVQVYVTKEDIDTLDPSKTDINIIMTARALRDTGTVEIVTRDLHERVIADILDIVAKDVSLDKVDGPDLYTGITTIKIDDNQVAQLCSDWQTGSIMVEGDFHPNQFIEMEDSLGNKHYGVYNLYTGGVHRLKPSYEAWGIKPKKDKMGNVVIEQAMLMHLLLDPNVNFVSAIGASGCGKTLLSLACGLEQAMGKFPSMYDKVVIMRPLASADRDIGALPGTKNEKLEPWMASSFDNLELLLGGYVPQDMKGYNNMNPMMSGREKIFGLIEMGKLELEALTYIRGRSMPKQFIIVDDAQNLTPRQAATIVTRAGDGTKLVFLGDVSRQQIDDKKLTPFSNGLAYTVDKFKGVSPLVGHVTMKTTVRSPLAELGVRFL